MNLMLWDLLEDWQLAVEKDRRQRVADSVAVGIWLESGVLDPLRRLKNVDCALLNLRCPTDNSFATLLPKYAAMAELLEDDIEANCESRL